jgi:NADP-dependent 3-hydroxy acid dehydrogenase YdfG
MTDNQHKTAIIIGASAGVGQATARALLADGARVIAIARGQEKLRALQEELGDKLLTIAADASDSTLAPHLLREYRPSYIVLAGGNRPEMGALDELSWESFSAAWSSDVQSSYHFLKAALSLPMQPGGSVVLLSSGAAINGSYLSGGYAGAKRMQWMLAGYAQQISNQRKLNLRFLSVIPKQLIEGTEIGMIASTTYGKTLGISSAEYMKRFDIPLTADKVAEVVMKGLRGEFGEGVTAIAATGKGSEAIG